ncbi:tigger transposable element-derived protein 6-like [Calliphora vicina]|uniref:tigger transposable element-derived protein 6-like n=1 Tax=Calliphora vicina TaxID=7373 RepID=UPI00325BD9E5
MMGKEDFSASSGWLDKFKLRHGIRYLKICGEKVSSDESAVEPFKKKFADIVAEMDLSKEQVYNADESAAFWRVLPGNTWVHTKEKSAPGRKISKDRVTFMPCSNAAGTHKLPLLVIGKSANPRAFKGYKIPVPMDQNLIQNVKVNYRKQLLQHILSENDDNVDVVKVLKMFSLKDAVYFLDLAWQSISEQNIQKSWSALWPRTAACWDDEDMIPLQVLRHELQSDSIYDGLKSIQNMIGTMNISNDITEEDINDWATGANEVLLDFSDEEIIQHAKRKESPVLLTDSEDDFVEMDAKTKISNADAKKSFSVCIQWAEENNIDMQDILLLKRLQQKAEINHLNKISQQKITSFFNKS